MAVKEVTLLRQRQQVSDEGAGFSTNFFFCSSFAFNNQTQSLKQYAWLPVLRYYATSTYCLPFHTSCGIHYDKYSEVQVLHGQNWYSMILSDGVVLKVVVEVSTYKILSLSVSPITTTIVGCWHKIQTYTSKSIV